MVIKKMSEIVDTKSDFASSIINNEATVVEPQEKVSEVSANVI